MTTHTELIDQAAALLQQAVALPTVGLTDQQAGEVLIATENAGRFLDGLRAITAADIDDRSRYELGAEAMCQKFGYTRSVHLIEYLIRIPAAEAGRRIRLGKNILPTIGFTGDVLPPKQPAIATAISEGTMGVDTAAHLTRLIKRTETTADPKVLADVIEDLITQGSVLSPDLIAVQVTQWETVLDADGTEPRAEAVHKRRAFRLGKESAGMTPFSGVLAPIDAGMFKALFTDAEAASSPRFLSDEDRTNGTVTTVHEDGSETTVDRDPRTPDQRNHDIVIGTLKAGVRASAKETGGMRPTATVSIVVTLEDLKNESGAGWVDQVAGPLSISGIQQALCDSQYQQVLLGNHGEVLYLGPLTRFFNDPQRRALAIRDGGCLWNGCTKPPRQCDAHHVVEYNQGGSTDINNGILLCDAHHHMLHASGYTIRMMHGKPFLQAPFWVDPSGQWRAMGKARTTQPMLSAFDSAVESSFPLPPEVFVLPTSNAHGISPSNRSRESDPSLEPPATPALSSAPDAETVLSHSAPEAAVPQDPEHGWYVEEPEDPENLTVSCVYRPTGIVTAKPTRTRRPSRPTITFADLAQPQSVNQRRRIVTVFSTPSANEQQ